MRFNSYCIHWLMKRPLSCFDFDNFFLQGLFRNFGDTFLPLFKGHLEVLVEDTAPGSHDSSQRCAAEIFAGIIRGSKHWTFEKVRQIDNSYFLQFSKIVVIFVYILDHR